MDQFKLDNLYQRYLAMVGIKEENMHPQQKVETKRAFMGACGIMLVTLREEVSVLSDDAAIEALENMNNQVHQFWLRENSRGN